MYIQPKNSYVKIKFSTWSPVKELFMFPKVSSQGWRENKKSLPTERLVKITLTLSSTLQEPWNEDADKHYYSDSHQNLLLKEITNKVFSEQDLGSKDKQLTAISTTENYKPRTNSRNKGNCDIACCLSELFDVRCRIYYVKHNNVRNTSLLDIRQPLDMVMLALFKLCKPY